VKHFTTPDFWKHYNKLPAPIKKTADKNINLLKSDPHHSSLKLKKVGNFWSVRITLKYRALGISSADNIIWFWVGDHDEYEKLIRS